MFHLPPLAICRGVALAVLADNLRRTMRLAPLLAWTVPAALLAIWAVSVALPFDLAIYSNPASQRIPENDQWQYVLANPSGYGINLAAPYLIQQQAKQQQTIHIIGLIPNCNGLQHLIPSGSRILVQCPPIPGDPSQQPVAAALVNQQAFEVNADGYDVWFVYEVMPHITLDGIAVPYQAETSFYRPGNLSHVTLYHIGTNRPNKR